jgi:uncharacterized protein (TIGR00251 family)
MTSPAPVELPCLKAVREGCVLTVQVVPNSSRTAVAGLHDGALRVRVAAPPIEGRANAELLHWLARSLGLPRRAMSLVSGDSNRRKRVHLDCAADAVAPWLRTQLSGAGGNPGS